MFKSSFRGLIALKHPHTIAIRAQSTKSTTINRPKTVKSPVASKVSKQKTDYNAFSNQNLTHKAQPVETLVRKAEKIKKDYSALPKVPSTSHLNPQKVAIDSFYAGYRPLAMHGLKQNLLPSRKKSLFELGIEDEPVWSYSASGLEVFSEWDSVPRKHFKDLVPFRPPMTEEQKQKKQGEEQKMMKKAAVEVKKEETKTKSTKTRKGRVRPGLKFLQKKTKSRL